MGGYGVEVVPFQHGYESGVFHCWALVLDHPCPRVAHRHDLWNDLSLCGQHEAQRERNGFRIVRLTAEQHLRAIADLDAEAAVGAEA